MNIIETLAYAGLGLAAEASDKAKSKFDELVETGKKHDAEGKNYVGDFFKTAESTKDDLSSQFNKGKEKLEERFPMLKDLEDRLAKAANTATEKFNSAKEDITEKANDAKDKFTSKAKETAEEVKEKVNNITKEAKVADEAK
ncbi:MAG: polyhydroxyalkanoate synthesis regulator phasin [Flavobacteriales bacterium]|jgi:polyhydroxyalkanoate synthesis regulator phasin